MDLQIANFDMQVLHHWGEDLAHGSLFDLGAWTWKWYQNIMTHLQSTNDDTSTTNISYGMYTVHRSSTARSYEQQDCFLPGEDVGAAIVIFRVQRLTITQTQTISTHGWSHYTHITLHGIGALAAWSCGRSLSNSVMSWMRPSSSKSLKTTHTHKHLLRNTHAYQQMESNTLMLHSREQHIDATHW